jgi:hypothetical protein
VKQVAKTYLGEQKAYSPNGTGKLDIHVQD